MLPQFQVDKSRITRRAASGFTAIDLLAAGAIVFLCAIIVAPAIGRTHNNSSLVQSMNNLRQLTYAWAMYPAQNNDRLVYSYPIYSTNTNSWVWGNEAGSIYTDPYRGADPLDIERGDLWPYVRTLSPYKCPDDKRLATQITGPYKNQPILRTYSMNSYLAGQTFGTAYDVNMLSPQTIDQCNFRLFTRQNQITKPAGIFVFVEEDTSSVDDGMFLVDMGQSTSRRGLLDLPTRHHSNSYPLTFADGHVETYRLQEAPSLSWIAGQTGGLKDWAALTNVTTVASR